MSNPVAAPQESWLGLISRVAGPFTALEALLALLILILAVARPRLGGTLAGHIERSAVRRFASPTVQIVSVGLLAIVARALFLPWLGTPVPQSHDEHSLILQGQTFLAGRLANPTPAFWEHFEAIHLNVVPAYASMYFPGRGLPLLLGMILADNPWIGVWISFVMMSMAAVWMLQAWVSAPFAFLGGILTTLRLGVFSYWMNSYWGGAFTALGAMLILGAIPRFLDRPGWGMGGLLGLGAAILLVTRPVEGALLCLPLAAFLLLAMWRLREHRFGRLLLRAGVPVALLVALSGGWMLAYNQATTGDALTTPYDVNRQAYAITPAFLISAPIHGEQRGPAYFRPFYEWEDLYYARRHSPVQMIRGVFSKIYYNWSFFVGFILTPAFLAGLWAMRRRPMLPATLLFFQIGYSFQTWNFPHYAAPVFPVFLIVIMAGFEWLRRWEPRGRPTGLFLTRAMPAGVLLSLLMPAATVVTGWPAVDQDRGVMACCKLRETSTRAEIASRLRALPGKDIVLISPDPALHPVHTPMPYNEPDLEQSDIVWAHLLGPERDEPMLAHYRGRNVWEVHWLGKKNYEMVARRH